jgi:hypothetical protein
VLVETFRKTGHVPFTAREGQAPADGVDRQDDAAREDATDCMTKLLETKAIWASNHSTVMASRAFIPPCSFESAQ